VEQDILYVPFLGANKGFFMYQLRGDKSLERAFSFLDLLGGEMTNDIYRTFAKYTIFHFRKFIHEYYTDEECTLFVHMMECQLNLRKYDFFSKSWKDFFEF
jgi:hypothetical protein